MPRLAPFRPAWLLAGIHVLTACVPAPASRERDPPPPVELDRVDSARVDSARVEPVRVDSAPAEPDRVEPDRVDSARFDSARVDPARVDSSRASPDEPAVSSRPDSSPADVDVAPGHPGCFILEDLSGGPILVGGAQPCDVPTIPASTFKVPHALIAMDTGVVTDVDAIVPWDGEVRWLERWNRDHSLRTALYDSVLWLFQGTAREIGRARMREYLEAFEFGNAAVEGPIDRFWLGGGSLRVSPAQMLRFWGDLYRDRLPRGAAHLPSLRSMLTRSPASYRGRLPRDATLPAVHPQMIFSAKTGTGRHGDGSVTWLVGHVECPDREHVFVSRVIASEPPDVRSPAVMHGLKALEHRGVLRCAVG